MTDPEEPDAEAEPKSAGKRELFSRIARSTGLTYKQVSSVFDALSEEVKQAVCKTGPGMFTIPNLLRIIIVDKPATGERRAINPFTKQEMIFKPMPHRRVVKAVPLPKLLDFARP